MIDHEAKRILELGGGLFVGELRERLFASAREERARASERVVVANLAEMSGHCGRSPQALMGFEGIYAAGMKVAALAGRDRLVHRIAGEGVSEGEATAIGDSEQIGRDQLVEGLPKLGLWATE